MAYSCGTASFASTGVKTITVGFQPVGMRITVSANAASQAINHGSIGQSDGTNSCYNSWYSDTTGSSSWQGTGKVANHFKRSGGVLVVATDATFDSFTATQVKFNVTTADVNYTYTIEAWD